MLLLPRGAFSYRSTGVGDHLDRLMDCLSQSLRGYYLNKEKGFKELLALCNSGYLVSGGVTIRRIGLKWAKSCSLTK